MNEKEYIEREAALLEIEEWADTFCECDYVWPHVVKSIRKLPAADVRPVVLCRDCVHYKAEQKGKPWKTNRRYCCRSACVATNPDDFCSRGEKREES